MKRVFAVSLALVLVLALGACSGAGATGSGTDVGVVLNEDYEDALPVLAQLLVGTIKLDEAGLAVEADVASQLIPLWEMARTLSSSDTAAEAEVEAITGQIQRALRPEQLQSISEMELTRDELWAIMGEQGIEQAGRGQNMSADERATALAERGVDPNIMAGTGGPGGGQGRGGLGENLNPEEMARLAEKSGGQVGVGIPAQLFDAVIELLESKAE